MSEDEKSPKKKTSKKTTTKKKTIKKKKKKTPSRGKTVSKSDKDRLLDRKEHLEKCIEKVEKAIADRATDAIDEYEITSEVGGRRVKKTSLKELRKTKAEFKRELLEVKNKIAKLEGVRPRSRVIVPVFR